jgi:hypothetical protein
MKKAASNGKNKPAADVVREKQQPKKGPVELDLRDLKQVSGGLPRGSWAAPKKSDV